VTNAQLRDYRQTDRPWVGKLRGVEKNMKDRFLKM
jgi:hypothetical protein